MIPKIIHYCWFGDAEIPEEYVQYIAEWKNLHPGWILKKWDESNVPNDVPYLNTSLHNSKWANASNYIRLYAVEKEGGIYLDIDFKLLKPLDPLLDNNVFMAFESCTNNNIWINNAAMGSVAGSSLLNKAIDIFLKSFDGLEEANLSGPQFITHFLLQHFPDINCEGYQNNQIHIYPKETFYPILYNERYKLADIEKHISENTFGVHVWGRTWFTVEKCLEVIDNLDASLFQSNLSMAGLNTELDNERNENLLKEQEIKMLKQELLHWHEKNNILTNQLRLLQEENKFQAEINFTNSLYLKKIEKKDQLIRHLVTQIAEATALNISLQQHLQQKSDISNEWQRQINSFAILAEKYEQLMAKEKETQDRLSSLTTQMGTLQCQLEQYNEQVAYYKDILTNSNIVSLIKRKLKNEF